MNHRQNQDELKLKDQITGLKLNQIFPMSITIQPYAKKNLLSKEKGKSGHEATTSMDSTITKILYDAGAKTNLKTQTMDRNFRRTVLLSIQNVFLSRSVENWL